MGETVKGTLVIIGGAEDKYGKAVILRRFLDLAAGEKAIIAVITTATEKADEVGRDYHSIFTRLGAAGVRHLDINNRLVAENSNHDQMLADVTGIFITGGDQVRITSILGGTAMEQAIKGCLQRGVVIAGTSAGASVMSNIMIVGGVGEDAPKQDTVRMAPGLALIDGVAIDQHFAQRGRINRLLSVVAQHPNVLGLGIDEDTAVVVDPHMRFEVIGNSTVTVADGRGLTFSNVSESQPNQALALFDVTLHMIPATHGFDLRNRRPLTPAELK